MHDPHKSRHTGLTQTALQIVQIARGAWPDIGVHRGRREPLIFANGVHHLGGGADERIGHHPAHDLFGTHLMVVVEEGIEKADHHRLKPALGEKLGAAFNLILIQRSFHHAGRRHQPFRHRNPVAPLDKRGALPWHIELE